jgi:hypothetical protein
MPKGEIRLKNGVSVHYDSTQEEGDMVVFKRSYSHDVQSVKKSEVDKITENEWHRTPFGSCKGLSDSEVRDAIRRHKD